jgi:preprotein translocase subunit YajC
MEAEKEKRNNIQVGYKIVTIGGVVGTVVEVTFLSRDQVQ